MGLLVFGVGLVLRIGVSVVSLLIAIAFSLKFYALLSEHILLPQYSISANDFLDKINQKYG